MEEAVITTTLIYGQVSASCQSECAMEKLADDYKFMYPDVSSFLLKSRYVDDLGESKSSYDQLEQLKLMILTRFLAVLVLIVKDGR